MTVRHSIYRRATTGGHAGLSALIGTRCYPDRLPADVTFPALRYQVVSAPPGGYVDHDANPPDRWTFRIQIDGFEASSDKADALGAQMFAAFQGWTSGTAVGGCQVENRFQDYDSILNRHRHMVELLIDHTV